MADVFISYAHTAGKQARAAATTLRAAGYSVWLDDDLAVHRTFTQEIEEQLTLAKAALVIWSADAAKSEWVLSEANRAREDRKLVQLVIDKTRLPMPFDQVQCADLSDWTGEGEHPNWPRVTASIRELVQGKTDGTSPAAPAREPAPINAEPLLAVLAFDNLSGDPEMAYFSDGVSQEIIDTVAQGSDLKVIARGSSFQLRGAEKTARNVAATLHATHLLDGAVRRAGSRVRISAQLVHCASETSLWTNRFDRQLEDIFELQDEIAGAVAEALRKAFSPRAASPAIEPDVYEDFLKAKSAVDDTRFWTPVGWGRTNALLEAVVARAPAFAAAWELLAVARSAALRFGWTTVGFDAGRQAAVEAAERALALDPSRGRAYSALVELEPTGAFQARMALVDKSLAIAPRDAFVLVDAARNYASVGRSREGGQFSRQACVLDPLLPLAQFWYASERAAAGHLDEAFAIFEALQSAGEMVPPILQWAAGTGRWDQFDRWRAAFGDDHPESPDFGPTVAHAERLRYRDPAAIGGFIDECRARIDETGTLRLDDLLWLSDYGQMEVAFELAEAASFDHMFRADGPPPSGRNALSVIFIPRAQGGMLRDPRFVRLCARLGLVHYWLSTGVWPDCADRVPYDFRAEARAAADAGLAAHV